MSAKSQLHLRLEFRVQSIFLRAKALEGKKGPVFQANGVLHRTGYQILQLSNLRTVPNCLARKENRVLKQIIVAVQIREMEKIIVNGGLKGRSLTWSQLGYEGQVDASEATIRRAIGSLDDQNCVPCVNTVEKERNRFILR